MKYEVKANFLHNKLVFKELERMTTVLLVSLLKSREIFCLI